jgi:Domain of unknown function (DUF892)
MTSAEQELMQSVEDTIVESAEVTGYNLLIQMAGKMNDMTDAILSLRQSLQEEENMFTWLRANAPAMFAKLWPEIEDSSPTTTTMRSSSSHSADKEQISKTNTTITVATENITPEVFDSSTYDSMTEIKKSATLNESETNKVFLDTEKKELIRPEMTNIKPKNKNNTKVSSGTAPTTVNPTMEWRASTLKQSREREKEESVADKKR